MAKVVIDDDEWWPVPYYELLTECPSQKDEAVDVPDEVLKEFDAAEKQFNAACAKLNEYRKS